MTTLMTVSELKPGYAIYERDGFEFIVDRVEKVSKCYVNLYVHSQWDTTYNQSKPKKMRLTTAVMASAHPQFH